jgi:hypothetical protein
MANLLLYKQHLKKQKTLGKKFVELYGARQRVLTMARKGSVTSSYSTSLKLILLNF